MHFTGVCQESFNHANFQLPSLAAAGQLREQQKAQVKFLKGF